MKNVCRIALVMLATTCGYDRAAADSPKTIVAVFDFACPAAPSRGADLAQRVRMRLRRAKGRMEVLDHLTMKELTPESGVSTATDAPQMAELITETVGATAAVWGDVEVKGASLTLKVRYLDLSQTPPLRWTQVFTDNTQRAAGILARRTVEAVRKRAEWSPPEYGDESEPAGLGSLPTSNLNPSFDKTGTYTPGWEAPDGVSTRLVDHPDRGGVLAINTHLDREPWLAWRHKLRLGQGDPNNPPAIGPAKSRYGNVGAIDGVHFKSDWIDARPGGRYWLTADVKGVVEGESAPLIFVKGYADFADDASTISQTALHERGLTAEAFAGMDPKAQKQLIADEAKAHPEKYRREVYRWRLTCRVRGTDWTHCAAPFPPRGGLPANVKYLRLHIFAYWPLGEYRFDNVRVTPAPEKTVKAPTSGTSPCPPRPTTADKP